MKTRFIFLQSIKSNRYSIHSGTGTSVCNVKTNNGDGPTEAGNYVMLTVRRNTFFCLTDRKKNSSETSAVSRRCKVCFVCFTELAGAILFNGN